jgi:hypothetical protein
VGLIRTRDFAECSSWRRREVFDDARESAMTETTVRAICKKTLTTGRHRTFANGWNNWGYENVIDIFQLVSALASFVAPRSLEITILSAKR